MIITRHSGSSHVVRPDQVYRTSVLQPIVGYQPQQDVMAVAQDFTQGPYAFQQGAAGSMIASGVSGLGAAGPRVTLLGPPIQFLGQRGGVSLFGFGDISNLGWLQKVWLKFKAWRASSKANAVLNASSLPGAGMSGLGSLVPFGPRQWAGQQVMPMPSDRMQMLVMMAQKNQPSVMAANNTAAVMQRWNYLRSTTR